MGKGQAVLVYLGYSKALDTISSSILLEKLASHSVDGCSVHRVKNFSGWPGPGNGVYLKHPGMEK